MPRGNDGTGVSRVPSRLSAHDFHGVGSFYPIQVQQNSYDACRPDVDRLSIYCPRLGKRKGLPRVKVDNFASRQLWGPRCTLVWFGETRSQASDPPLGGVCSSTKRIGTVRNSPVAGSRHPEVETYAGLASITFSYLF